MHYDDLLKILGEFGFYQKVRLTLICLVSIVCAWHSMNMVFVGAKPHYTCRAPELNMSRDPWRNATKTDIETVFALTTDGGCSRNNIGDVLRLVNNSRHSLSHLMEMSANISKEPCDGWTYSRDRYASTIVSEVSRMMSTIVSDVSRMMYAWDG
jgi:hypothetical protein